MPFHATALREVVRPVLNSTDTATGSLHAGGEENSMNHLKSRVVFACLVARGAAALHSTEATVGRGVRGGASQLARESSWAASAAGLVLPLATYLAKCPPGER